MSFSFFKVTALTGIMLTPMLLQAETASPVSDKNSGKEKIRSYQEHKTVVKAYRMRSVHYQQLESMIQSQLSKEGKATYLKGNNKLLVIDYPSVQEKIKEIVTLAADQQQFNIKVSVQFNNLQQLQQRGIRVHGGPVIINRGKVKTPGINIRLEDKRQKHSSYSEVFLTISNGGQAELWSGRVSHQLLSVSNYKLYDYFTRQSVSLTEVQFHPEQTGISMLASARHLGQGLIEVHVYPQITTKDGQGRTRRYKVQGVQSTLRIQNGARVPLGGGENRLNKFYNSLFPAIGAGSKSEVNYLNISIKADLLRVTPPRKRKP